MGDRIQPGHFLSLNEAYNTKIEFYLIELLAKETHGNTKQPRLLTRV